MNILPTIMSTLVATVALIFLTYITRNQYKDLKDGHRDLKDGLRELKEDVRVVHREVGDVRRELADVRSDLFRVALAVGAEPRTQSS